MGKIGSADRDSGLKNRTGGSQGGVARFLCADRHSLRLIPYADVRQGVNYKQLQESASQGTLPRS